MTQKNTKQKMRPSFLLVQFLLLLLFSLLGGLSSSMARELTTTLNEQVDLDSSAAFASPIAADGDPSLLIRNAQLQLLMLNASDYGASNFIRVENSTIARVSLVTSNAPTAFVHLNITFAGCQIHRLETDNFGNSMRNPSFTDSSLAFQDSDIFAIDMVTAAVNGLSLVFDRCNFTLAAQHSLHERRTKLLSFWTPEKLCVVVTNSNFSADVVQQEDGEKDTGLQNVFRVTGKGIANNVVVVITNNTASTRNIRRLFYVDFVAIRTPDDQAVPLPAASSSSPWGWPAVARASCSSTNCIVVSRNHIRHRVILNHGNFIETSQNSSNTGGPRHVSFAELVSLEVRGASSAYRESDNRTAAGTSTTTSWAGGIIVRGNDFDFLYELLSLHGDEEFPAGERKSNTYERDTNEMIRVGVARISRCPFVLLDENRLTARLWRRDAAHQSWLIRAYWSRLRLVYLVVGDYYLEPVTKRKRAAGGNRRFALISISRNMLRIHQAHDVNGFRIHFFGPLNMQSPASLAAAAASTSRLLINRNHLSLLNIAAYSIIFVSFDAVNSHLTVAKLVGVSILEMSGNIINSTALFEFSRQQDPLGKALRLLLAPDQFRAFLPRVLEMQGYDTGDASYWRLDGVNDRWLENIDLVSIASNRCEQCLVRGGNTKSTGVALRVSPSRFLHRVLMVGNSWELSIDEHAAVRGEKVTDITCIRLAAGGASVGIRAPSSFSSSSVDRLLLQLEVPVPRRWIEANEAAAFVIAENRCEIDMAGATVSQGYVTGVMASTALLAPGPFLDGTFIAIRNNRVRVTGGGGLMMADASISGILASFTFSTLHMPQTDLLLVEGNDLEVRVQRGVLALQYGVSIRTSQVICRGIIVRSNNIVVESTMAVAGISITVADAPGQALIVRNFDVNNQADLFQKMSNDALQIFTCFGSRSFLIAERIFIARNSILLQLNTTSFSNHQHLRVDFVEVQLGYLGARPKSLDPKKFFALASDEDDPMLDFLVEDSSFKVEIIPSLPEPPPPPPGRKPVYFWPPSPVDVSALSFRWRYDVNRVFVTDSLTKDVPQMPATTGDVTLTQTLVGREAVLAFRSLRVSNVAVQLPPSLKDTFFFFSMIRLVLFRAVALPPIQLVNVSVSPIPIEKNNQQQQQQQPIFSVVNISAFNRAHLPHGLSEAKESPPRQAQEVSGAELPHDEFLFDGVDVAEEDSSSGQADSSRQQLASSFAEAMCTKEENDDDSAVEMFSWSGATVTLGMTKEHQEQQQQQQQQQHNNNLPSAARSSKRLRSIATPARQIFVLCPSRLLRTRTRSGSRSIRTRTDGNETLSRELTPSNSSTFFSTNVPEVGLEKQTRENLASATNVLAGFASLASMSATAALSASRGQAALSLLQCAIEHQFDHLATEEDGGGGNYTTHGKQAVRRFTESRLSFYVSFFPGLGFGSIKGRAAAPGFYARGALFSHLVGALILLFGCYFVGSFFCGRWRELKLAVLRERQVSLTRQQREAAYDQIHNKVSPWAFSPHPKAMLLFFAIMCSNICTACVILVWASRQLFGSGGDAAFAILALLFFVSFLVGSAVHLYRHIFPGPGTPTERLIGVVPCGIYFDTNVEWSPRQKMVHRFLQTSPLARKLFLSDETWDNGADEWSFSAQIPETRLCGAFSKPPGLFSGFGTSLLFLEGPSFPAQRQRQRNLQEKEMKQEKRRLEQEQEQPRQGRRGASSSSARRGARDEDAAAAAAVEMTTPHNNSSSSSNRRTRSNNNSRAAAAAAAAGGSRMTNLNDLDDPLLRGGDDDGAMLLMPRTQVDSGRSRNNHRAGSTTRHAPAAAAAVHESTRRSGNNINNNRTNSASGNRHVRQEPRRESSRRSPAAAATSATSTVSEDKIITIRQRVAPFTAFVETAFTFLVTLFAAIGQVERQSCKGLLVAVLLLNALASLFVLALRAERVLRRAIESALCAILLLLQALIIAAVIAQPLHDVNTDAVAATQLIVGIGLIVVSVESVLLNVCYKGFLFYSKSRLVSMAALRRIVKLKLRSLPERLQLSPTRLRRHRQGGNGGGEADAGNLETGLL